MNWIAIVILVTLCLHYLIDCIADYLNLSVLSPDIPADFAGVYNAEQYVRAQEYLRVKTRFNRLVTTFDLAVFLGFWFFHGFEWLDQWVRTMDIVSGSPVMTGIFYIAVLLGAKALLELPFAIYATFVIEARFGFNTTTWRTFVTDRLKIIVLAAVIGLPLVSAILWFFENAGGLAWLWCWAGVSLFMMIMQVVVPAWIMPLFNKFEPLEAGELKTGVMEYARTVKFPLTNVFVMDGSKRSAKSNAFFAGFGQRKRLVLFDTLISNHPVAHIVAVVAHEIGHYKKRHVLWGLILAILQAGVMFYLLSLFISYEPLFHAFFVQTPSVYAGLVFFGILFSPIEFFVGLLVLAHSRHNEYAADRFAAETTGMPDALADALKKLSVDNLSNLTPHPFYVFLHYSHPPVKARVDALGGRLKA
ncbi:MAG: M48 family metallopeptidase [Thermodesulfobacteriota bacterium]|nr:M48 family metallopeptidase [Thermodesulfobacteriota bacterium]